MAQFDTHEPDFGTGQKKLSVYIVGMIICAVLTLFSFWAVISQYMSDNATVFAIFTAAIIQFFVQLICFLRLNVETTQGKMNVMTFIFTGLILMCIVVGSLWIMWNLGYNMMH